MINRTDVLAYLVVLAYHPVLAKLSVADNQTGHLNMAGCLNRVVSSIEEGSYLKQAILERERLNGLHPVGHPDLQAATVEVATLLEAYLIGAGQN